MVGGRVPARGYKVEIDTPSGETLRPRLLDHTDWQPTVNGRPGFVAVTPYSERKHDRFNALLDESNDIEARAWKDGVRLPIDSLEDVAPDRSAGTLTLTCTGGRQLTRYRTIQIDEEESDVAIRDFLGDETDYATDIDVPDTRIREDVRQFQALTGDQWEELLANELESDGTFPDDVPLELDGTDLKLLQTTFVDEAEFGDYQGSLTAQDDRYSDERAVRLNSAGDYVEIDPSEPYEYTIPEGELVVAWRWAIDAPTDHTIDVDMELQTSEENVTLDFLAGGGDGSPYNVDWSSEIINQQSGGVTGAVDARLVLNSPAYDQDADEEVDTYVDVMTIEDDRYKNGGRADQTDANALLPSPRLAPSINVETVGLGTIERVVGGKLTIDAISPTGDGLNKTSEWTGLAVSNDGGDTWPISATDTESVSGDFSTPSNEIRARLTLGPTGSGFTSSPSEGQYLQSIDLATIFADLENTPVVLSELFEGTIASTITAIVEDADMNWELRRDPATDASDRDGMLVAATQAGQRQRDSRARVVDVSGRRTIEDSYDRVIVEGRSATVEEESFSFNNNQGVGLEEQNIIVGSETITSSDGSTVYEYGEHYEMDYEEGFIERIDMDGTATFLATYQWKPRDQYPSEQDLSDDGITEPETLNRQAASASTARQCGQLALLLYQQVNEPLEELEVTLTAEAPDASLIAALDHPEIPFETVQITGGDHQPGQIRLSAESRLSSQAEFDRLRDQLKDVAEQV